MSDFKIQNYTLISYKGSDSHVEIPQGVKAIGRCAFYGCKNLKGVTIPEGVTAIGRGAFAQCTNLEEIKVAEGNTKFSSIDGVLYTKDQTTMLACPQAKAMVEIPAMVEAFKKGVFDECTKLEEISVAAESNAFSSIKGAIYTKDQTTLVLVLPTQKVVDLPATCTTLAKGAFRGCTNLIAINADAKSQAFASVDGVLCNKDITKFILCPKGKAKLVIPATIKRVDRTAFEGCTNLKSVVLPYDGYEYGSAFRSLSVNIISPAKKKQEDKNTQASK